MYYPILRARQFELITLRELVQDNELSHIRPILEPVNKSSASLEKALDIFKVKNKTVYLILNPIVGDFKERHDALVDFGVEQDPHFTNIKPAFYIYDDVNIAQVRNWINMSNMKDCLLVFPSNVSVDTPGLKDLIESKEVSEFVIQDPGSNRGLTRFVLGTGKNCIRLDDLFESEKRNSDFLEKAEHKYTEEHLFYRDEKFNGFSDYTVLDSGYTDGGGAARAVVIHLTYFNPDHTIWIRHFTSETNATIANVQGKFAEAAKKAVKFCNESNLHNSALEELRDYYNREHYPGLGVVKKICIKNHLLLVNNYLKK